MINYRFEEITEKLKQLYNSWSGVPAETIVPLPVSGSSRAYFRIKGKKETVVGAFNANTTENKAFFYLTNHFRKKGLPVPELLIQSKDNDFYLIEDLGDTTLLKYLTINVDVDYEKVKSIYPRVIHHLIEFQISGHQGLDYSNAYPREAFDRQSIQWDLNYFKYLFLKLLQVEFDEQALEHDFNIFADYLLSFDHDYFMFRDFQSRNIMIRDEKLYYIDYQGGRKGALAYDVASLLFESKTNIPVSLKETLLEDYIRQISKHLTINASGFHKQYYAYALVRLMQALGAYGYRGLYENKPLFVPSIYPGTQNLQYIAGKLGLKKNLPELYRCFDIVQEKGKAYQPLEGNALTVSVQSFSYRGKLPVDPSGNGGGFYFDCRGLPNPGRSEAYKHLTGKNKAVQDYLLQQDSFHAFINNAREMVDASVKNYFDRGFKHLMVCFGCTGGQHRSVFSAEIMANHLKNNYPMVRVVLKHNQIE